MGTSTSSTYSHLTLLYLTPGASSTTTTTLRYTYSIHPLVFRCIRITCHSFTYRTTLRNKPRLPPSYRTTPSPRHHQPSKKLQPTMMHQSNKSAASTLFALSALLSIATPFLSTTAAAHGGLSGAGHQHQHHKRAALAAAPARSRHAGRQPRSEPAVAQVAKRSDIVSPGIEFLKVNDIYVGFLPDDGSGGGSSESMSQINSMLPAKSAWHGRYAQVTNGKTFDGNQLYMVMDDVTSNGAIFAASVMPYKTWYGLTESDNSNAIAIAKVCNDIYEKHGVEVWLSFAHEMNWYCTDGTYSGGYESCVNSFQTAWKLVAAAVKEHAPQTKMWWSPNVGSDKDYDNCYPKEGHVDVIGFDWYPQSATESFVDRAKPFYDKFAKGDIVMVQGETGLHYTGSTE